MFPFSNQIIDNNVAFWDRQSLLHFLGWEESAASHKKLDRNIVYSSYLPPIVQLNAVVDENNNPLKKNLLNYDVDSIHGRRGKWLILQFFQKAGAPPLIMSNDGRGARSWIFAENGQDIKSLLSTFISALKAATRKPLLLILHKELAVHHNDFSDTRLISVVRSSYAESHLKSEQNQLSPSLPSFPPSHLDRLEAEGIHIIREVVAETKNPVMLYSIGKDSAVMLHLARKAFWPGTPPFPLLHVDTGWKFRAMYEFRDQVTRATGMELLIHINSDGVKKGINPLDHGSATHTDIMKTQGLKQALNLYHFDAAFGGARRDEEKSRAKERIFSFRTHTHQWDPKNQRPELWNLYNTRVSSGETMRVFPLSNWTELDIWSYIYREDIPIVPLYFAAERPVIERDGTLIMVDDERLTLTKADNPRMQRVRFRTLGCYPLTGAIESNADTLEAIILELLTARQSERQGRTIDKDSVASMEQKKMEGYF